MFGYPRGPWRFGYIDGRSRPEEATPHGVFPFFLHEWLKTTCSFLAWHWWFERNLAPTRSLWIHCVVCVLPGTLSSAVEYNLCLCLLCCYLDIIFINVALSDFTDRHFLWQIYQNRPISGDVNRGTKCSPLLQHDTQTQARGPSGLSPINNTLLCMPQLWLLSRLRIWPTTCVNIDDTWWV